LTCAHDGATTGIKSMVEVGMDHASFVRAFVVRARATATLGIALSMTVMACGEAPPVAGEAAALSDFDPVVATTAVGTIPGDASVTADGTFTYGMPIEVPPGRVGMQPSLAITYASSEVESALGVGFSLSGLSSITRCPRTIAQDGERRDVDQRRSALPRRPAARPRERYLWRGRCGLPNGGG
jgi:hypothetical protein